MNRRYLQEIMRSIQEFHHCPSCATHYNFSDIKLLGQIDQYCFLQLTCHQCSLPVLTTAAVQKEGQPAAVRTGTDLTLKEETKFQQRGVITHTEIADFYRFLSAWKGGLHDGRRSPKS